MDNITKEEAIEQVAYCVGRLLAELTGVPTKIPFYTAVEEARNAARGAGLSRKEIREAVVEGARKLES